MQRIPDNETTARVRRILNDNFQEAKTSVKTLENNTNNELIWLKITNIFIILAGIITILQ